MDVFFLSFFKIIGNLYIYHAINYKLFLNIDDIDGMFVFFFFCFFFVSFSFIIGNLPVYILPCNTL